VKKTNNAKERLFKAAVEMAMKITEEENAEMKRFESLVKSIKIKGFN